MAEIQRKNRYDIERISGCGTIILFTFLTLWVAILSVFDLFTNWILEQSIFESATSIPDIRWINHGVIALILLVSLLIAFFVVKTPHVKQSLHIWFLAAILALILTPAKTMFITYQQPVAAIQILVLAIYSVVLYFFNVKNKTEPEKRTNLGAFFGLSALFAAAISIPWIVFGALGSAIDILLCIVLGLNFAFFTYQVLFPYLFNKTQSPSRDLNLSDFFIDGLTVAIFLLICMTGLAQNGSQLLMVIILPISGWIIAGIAIIGRKKVNQAKISVALISGLVFILPLLWFDADELSLLVNGAPGETLEWAMKAAWWTMGIQILLVILMVIYFKFIERVQMKKRTNILLGFFSLALLVFVYFVWGRPGLFGDKIFVIMKNQADLTASNQITDLSKRKQAVYDALIKTATTSQSDLRKQLEDWKISYSPYYLVDGIEVDAGPYYDLLLQKRSDVDRILPSPRLRPLPKKVPLTNNNPVDLPAEPSWNLSLIGADKVHEDLGISGKGIVIGQTDTGVDGYHPELSSSYRGYDGKDDYNWLDPWNQSIFPTDVQGHGTSTLGIITGKNIGIAPGAEWIGCVNLARDLGNPAVYLNCLQFMLAPYPQKGDPFTQGNPEKGAMIVNNSWGCPKVEGCDSAVFLSVVKAMESAGIFMSVAAGNSGNFGCSTVSDPLAIYADVFTVGSINQSGNVSDFSSLGPVTIDGSNRVKPNLLAPGEGIISAFPDKTYTQADGTSFAAPHVSGVVALMWSANPKLIGNIELTKKILEETASPYTGTLPTCVSANLVPNNASGYGILNAYAAVQAAQAIK
ncbi:MAG: S8 family serine peptidase [Anaerolineaceae bacterium]